jgi:hypothetical protein
MGCGVTWRFVNAASRGTSHDASSTPCQDDCFVDVTTSVSGEPVLVAVVADGAGSAARSEVGSGIACASVIDRMNELLARCEIDAFRREDVEAWLVHVRSEIDARAQSEELETRQFACTILGCAIGTDSAAFFQIGDGAIVISDGTGLRPVFWPEPGQYANMTHFLTDSDFAAHLMFTRVAERIEEVALFSDGLQRLALVFADRSVHAPFFDPMLRQLRAQPPGPAETFVFPLLRFLSSDAVNARTDDDKSLVLATRRV